MGDIDDINDMSTINGKPVDAMANLNMYFDMKEFKTSVEKVFGVVLKKSNVALKFNLIFSYTLSPGNDTKFKFKYQLKLIYLSEDPIDCKIQISTAKPEFLQNLTCGNQLFEHTGNYNSDSKCTINIFISLFLRMPSKDLPLLTQISSSFNDESSSDFTVECQEKEFHVHQYILRQRSEYFAGMLRNNCIESENKRIVINDFEPKIVEILLRYLYNGALCWSAIKSEEKLLISLIKIADKYNLSALVDAIDSHCSQHYQYVLNYGGTQLAIIEKLMTITDNSLLPKLVTVIFLWKNSDKSEISDEQWSKLIHDHPGFVQLMAHVSCRKDYQEWGRQHRNWFLAIEETDPKIDTPKIINDAAIIVGSLGEMKGAVKCSSIL